MTLGRPGAPTVRALGDAAVLVELGTTVDLETNRRVRALARLVEKATRGEQGWGSPIPGACSVLVPVDPLEPGVAAALERLGTLAAEATDDALDRATDDSGPILDIPTRYDGPDLDAVADMTGLSVGDVIARHAGATYTTFFLGFAPGFAYLGPLAPELALPRRPVPRTHVPAGSVAIAGAQTAVYPLESPGGWWLIGRTDLAMWAARQDPPALLHPGARVRFVPTESEA